LSIPNAATVLLFIRRERSGVETGLFMTTLFFFFFFFATQTNESSTETKPAKFMLGSLDFALASSHHMTSLHYVRFEEFAVPWAMGSCLLHWLGITSVGLLGLL